MTGESDVSATPPDLDPQCECKIYCGGNNVSGYAFHIIATSKKLNYFVRLMIYL